MTEKQNFIIIGHRGEVGNGIGENTLPSFERALQDGADGIEFDVYNVRDNAGKAHLVVMHDDLVDRTTTGAGDIRSLSFEQISELRAGDDKSQDKADFTQRVPEAAEVLDVARKFISAGNQILVNIELKGPDTAGETAKLIQEYISKGIPLNSFIVSSFDHPQLEQFHAQLPEVRTAILVDDKQFADFGETLDPAIALAQKIGSFAVNPGLFATPELIRDVTKSGLEVYMWTGASKDMVDGVRDHAVYAYKSGAKGFFANNISAAQAAIKEIS